MKLEKIKDQEIAQRQGQTRRTLIQLGWLVISAAIGYVLAEYVIFADGGLLTYGQVYTWLSISPNDVPTWVILAAVVAIIVFIMQFFLLLGFFVTSAEGRRRPGDPSLHSRHKDPMDQY
jgi:H+/Cl- antiporter ClcA